MIEVVCFDLGGVVVRLRPTFEACCIAAGVAGASELAPDDVFGSDLNERHQLGAIDGAAFAEGVRERLDGRLTTESILAAHAHWIDGEYVPEAVQEISHLMRDWRLDLVRRFDRRALDVLSAAHRRLDVDEPFQVISGYRSPETNAMLRRRSRGRHRGRRRGHRPATRRDRDRTRPRDRGRHGSSPRGRACPVRGVTSWNARYSPSGPARRPERRRGRGRRRRSR